MRIIALTTLLLILTTIPASAGGGALLVGQGHMLDAFTFPDGGSVTIAYYSPDSCIRFDYAPASGAPVSECHPIPDDLGIPYTYESHICGRYVQLFGNWPGENMDGPLFRFDFRMPKNSGVCDLGRLR